MRLALAQYPISRFAHFAQWQMHVKEWVGRAVRQRATFLSFPEYGGMELTSLLPEKLQKDLTGQIPALGTFHADFLFTWSALARKHGIFIQAPSLPVTVKGKIHNRAYLFAPSGKQDFQDKRQMTRFEKEEWNIQGGKALKVFNLGETKIGIAVCYDIEFPLIAHAMAEAGADLVLAPSCTDTLAGANRVHLGARARALENQIYVGVAPTVGRASWSPAVDVNIGWAGFYAAPDRWFPDDGILARGERNRAGWVIVEPDFTRLKQAREEAQVFTRRDWPSQSRPNLTVTSISL